MRENGQRRMEMETRQGRIKCSCKERIKICYVQIMFLGNYKRYWRNQVQQNQAMKAVQIFNTISFLVYGVYRVLYLPS
jgi:endo-alpha-1,4-polygalactosaminidase (GH114 family)